MPTLTAEREGRGLDIAELSKLMDDLSVNDVLRILGTMFDEDFRRIRRWR